MENKKEKIKVSPELERKIKGIFDKAAKESNSNSMTTTSNHYSIAWRPNNYRRQIEVRERTNSTLEKIRKANTAININPHTKLVSWKKYQPNITIQLGKTKLTAIYSQNIIAGVKEIYEIERPTIKELELAIDEKKQIIQDKCHKALKDFSKQFKIGIPSKKEKWTRYEDFLKDVSYLYNIPKEMVIHDTVAKNGYDQGIEFISSELQREPTVSLKNTIKNQALNDFSPEIAKELAANNMITRNTFNILNKLITENAPALAEFHQDIKVHNAAIKKLDESITKLNFWQNPLENLKHGIRSIDDVFANKGAIEALTLEQKQVFEQWLMERF